MFAGFPQRIFYLVTGTGPPCTTVYLPATPPDSAELANNASFIVSFSRGETGSILNEMKRQENAAAWFLKNKPPDQSAFSGFVVSSTSILKLLISLLHFRPSPRDVCHGGQGEGIMTGGFLFVCVLYVNETRASEVSLCPEAACMFLFYFIFKYVTVVYSKQQECSRTAVVV